MLAASVPWVLRAVRASQLVPGWCRVR